ncbi:MAG: 30S ribosomal protein S16 [bacterium]|jgi:small subunit ribosomal protein S16
MPVRIRLRRVGRKKQPSYRIVVADSRNPRDGAYVESLGFYNPRRQPAELRLDLAKVDYWLERGAQPTETAAALIRKARKGGDATVVLLQPAEEPRGAKGGAAAPAASEAPAPRAEAPAAEAGAASEPAAASAAPSAGEGTAAPEAGPAE